jgi:hypothetical protein
MIDKSLQRPFWDTGAGVGRCCADPGVGYDEDACCGSVGGGLRAPLYIYVRVFALLMLECVVALRNFRGLTKPSPSRIRYVVLFSWRMVNGQLIELCSALTSPELS